MVREEIQMNHELASEKQQERTDQRDQRVNIEQTLKSPPKISSVFVISQVLPSLLLLVCALFGIFVGIRFLTFIERTESHRSTLSAKWSETGFEQLQQMNATIKQELDLILDQRRENLLLQQKISKLTANRSTPKQARHTVVLPSLIQEIKQ
ncbi:MAG: hypothetical protein A3F67_00380 [Verrucomicrobia bacterium RIFCSPHIGHO2_12_FULL_41_10]|nr:MAG: hypothetical protein A3F67_00380 [Verrucomicrobia bacterium RIFCSPHIGHO2_12_FULL_41_10]